MASVDSIISLRFRLPKLNMPAVPLFGDVETRARAQGTAREIAVSG